MPLLQENQFEIKEYNDDYFKGTITVDKGKETVFTSIPYDSAWQVYVDGEKVETFKILEGLVAFNAKAGQHNITLKYRPFTLWLGIAGTGAGLVGFAAAWYVTEVYRKKKVAEGVPEYCPSSLDDVCPPQAEIFEELTSEEAEETTIEEIDEREEKEE